mmetsp:Transcript_17975/g.27827  ORF Transcript_17975/g.27827 Transcript_17975/m.27827 type:complete len:133 (-) Transcript_17975:1238-1636(-)
MFGRYLLKDRRPDLYGRILPAMSSLVRGTITSLRQRVLAINSGLGTYAHPETQIYHLFGFDVICDAEDQVWLLEVNSYPAIASGTMTGVPTRVYNRLISDLVAKVVLPSSDGHKDDSRGGFICLDDDAASSL